MEKTDFINSQDSIIEFKTGGTTSAGCTVKKSVQNMKEESRDIFETLKLEKGLEFITTTTHEHLFGFTFHFMLPMMYGYKIREERINYPEDINVENALLVTTPSFLEAMRKYNSKPAVKPKVIISAGAELKPETFKYALTIAQRVIEIYGSTETGVIAYRESPRNKMKIFKGIKILETGEDYTKIDTKYSLETPVIIKDRISIAKNRLNFEGRCGNVLKIQEKRVAANDMEQAIIDSGYVKECYCFEHNGKLAALAIPSQKGSDCLVKHDKLTLVKLLKLALLGRFEIVPQRWQFIDEIPTKPNGKINKELITEMFNINLSMPLVLSRELTDGCASFRLCFLNNSNFFKGHFEGIPVLPGVVQLFWASYFIKLAFGIDTHVGQLRKIKFSNIIRPTKIVELKLERVKIGINYQYQDSENVYSLGIMPAENIYENVN